MLLVGWWGGGWMAILRLQRCMKRRIAIQLFVDLKSNLALLSNKSHNFFKCLIPIVYFSYLWLASRALNSRREQERKITPSPNKCHNIPLYLTAPSAVSVGLDANLTLSVGRSSAEMASAAAMDSDSSVTTGGGDNNLKRENNTVETKEVPVSSLGQIPMLRPNVGSRRRNGKSRWSRSHRQDVSCNGRKKRTAVRCGSRKPANPETGSGFADFEAADFVRIFDCCWIWIAQKKTDRGWTRNRVKKNLGFSIEKFVEILYSVETRI